MKIILTGGAGFFGFHIARALQHHQVSTLDLEVVSDSERLAGAHYFQGDIRDRALLEEVCEGADVIVHAAAALPLWKPREIRSVNQDGTQAVLETAKKLGIPRVVHISSTAVYGIPDHHPLHEQDNLVGVGPYGESKVSAEQLCEQARADGLTVCVLRPKTFIGPERLGVFQILFEWVREGRRIPVIGSGKNQYQLLDVADASSAVRTLVEAPEELANAAFNCGATEFSSVEEDLDALFVHADSGSRILKTPAPLAKGALAILEWLRLSPLYRWIWGTADQDSWVDVTALRNLGWEPKHSNADTLIRTYDWYLAHRQDMEAAGTGHRVPWSEGALAVLKRFL
ncbi:MAG: NAD(P)-dependent oxidoreductase [Planctomycetes bacterium]|nr:NAD(P)-dependent oxidoreductase [Planctomycetota bacterium]